MRVRIAIVLAALAVPMLLPGTVGAQSAQAAARAEQARIAAYWTPERMASAKSKDYVKDAKTGKMIPYARPGGGGGGSTVTGASWTGGGVINDRSGKLFFSTTAGNWQCSASVVDDGSTTNGYSIILTAGHCTYDKNEGWSFNVQFIPNYDANPVACGSTVWGCWNGATRLAVNKTFFSEGGFGTDKSAHYDYGFMRLGAGGKGGSVPSELDRAVGGYALRSSAINNSAQQWAFGYPAAGKYKGKDLTYCAGTTSADPYGTPGVWGMACNMTGGSSGGPWLSGTANPADGSGVLSSLNSYGYQGLTYMFGPIFDGGTITVKDDLKALNASATTTFN